MTPEQSEHWLYAMRLGDHPLGREHGWVLKALLTLSQQTEEPRPVSIDAEMSVTFRTPSPAFRPFLGSWQACLKMLTSLAGLWEDDRGRKAKSYKLTVFAEEGYANVLTEMPCGSFRGGPRLIKVQKVAHGVFAIFWSESFVLNSEACGKNLKWLPICEKSRSTWKWQKKV